MKGLLMSPAGKALAALVVISLLALGYVGYRYRVLARELQSVRGQFAESTKFFEGKVAGLEQDLSDKTTENVQLAENLQAEKDRMDALAEEVGEATDTVGFLHKLSRTDPELLQKYSKVYFLNEHYAPPRLATITASKYLYSTERTQQIHADVWPHLSNMLEAALEDDITLKIVSAYRSFDTQSSLKAAYKVTYGSGANTFSADQGYSEHQLGTTVDFTTTNLTSDPLAGFGATPAYRWLLDNAHRYGFVLSYPQNNQYYVFEPWHWRFIGKELATKLHREDVNFYDWDQREIDEYLVKIFD